MDTSIQGYLAAAKVAVAYVYNRMTWGAHDNPRNALVFKGVIGNIYVKHKVEKARAEIDAALEAAGPMSPAQHNEFYIEAQAAAALRHGAGNCGEQAALAFMHLKGMGIRPLDFAGRTNGDHGVVIIGATQPIRSDNFKEWSYGAVVCDPWGMLANIAGMLQVRYPHSRWKSQYRLEL